MSRVIYAKYNKLRRPAYRTCTLILSEDGKRFVEKRPLCEAAKPHLANMRTNRVLLAELLPELTLLPIGFSREDDAPEGTVTFPFVEGESESAILFAKAKEGKEAFFAAWDALFHKLFPEEEKCCAFDNSEDFVRIFGNREELWGSPAASPANIDAVTENLIRVDGKTVCLDYEWVVSAPVPLSYLRYRAIRYFYEALPGTEEMIRKSELYARYGIGSELLSTFAEMELSFQKEVFGREQDARYTENYKQGMRTLADRNREEQDKDAQIVELLKVVEHYQGVERKLRKIGVWQTLSGAQKLVRKIRK